MTTIEDSRSSGSAGGAATASSPAAQNKALGSELLHDFIMRGYFDRHAYRVLELPAGATRRQMEKRRQAADAAASHGTPMPAGPARCLPLKPEPDAFAVREALQRLADPRHQLVDEFFWFWSPEAATDPGIEALVRGDTDGAGAIWTQPQTSAEASTAALHNLSVLYLISALSLSESDEAADRAAAPAIWQEAFKCWHDCIADDGARKQVRRRVDEISDPRLDDAAQALHSALPRALSGLPLLFLVTEQDPAIRAALIKTATESGFASDEIAAASKSAVTEIVAKVTKASAVARKAAEADALHADHACTTMMDQAEPLLHAIDQLLPDGDPARTKSHDEAASAALQCQVAYCKTTDQWDVGVTLLTRAGLLAVSPEMKENLRSNLEIVRRHADTNDDFRGPGYHDLTGDILAKMEEARTAAVANNYDKAEPILRTLLGRAQPGAEVFLVRKALAYVLGCAAIRRINESISKVNESPTILAKIRARADNLDPMAIMCAKMETIPPYTTVRCMACGYIISGRYSIMRLADVNMPLLVCGDCADAHRREMSSRQDGVKSGVRKATSEFAEAAQLDPANKFISRQMDVCKDLCSKLEISFADAAKVKTPSKPVAVPTRASTPVSSSKPVGTSSAPASGASSTKPNHLLIGLATTLGLLVIFTGLVISGKNANRQNQTQPAPAQVAPTPPPPVPDKSASAASSGNTVTGKSAALAFTGLGNVSTVPNDAGMAKIAPAAEKSGASTVTQAAPLAPLQRDSTPGSVPSTQLVEDNNEQFLATNAKRSGVITTPSGLQYEVIRAGRGRNPTIRDRVTVHYEGSLINGKIFDSSMRRGEPASFPLSGVISGWVEGVQQMNIGSKFKFFIPPKLAYGTKGAPPDIGPDATLIFEVELLRINGSASPY